MSKLFDERVVQLAIESGADLLLPKPTNAVVTELGVEIEINVDGEPAIFQSYDLWCRWGNIMGRRTQDGTAKRIDDRIPN